MSLALPNPFGPGLDPGLSKPTPSLAAPQARKGFDKLGPNGFPETTR
jgi:hypothetical protein